MSVIGTLSRSSDAPSAASLSLFSVSLTMLFSTLPDLDHLCLVTDYALHDGEV